MWLRRKIYRQPWGFCLLVSVLVVVLYACVRMSSYTPSFRLPDGVELDKYEPFEPVADSDFGEGVVRKVKIPKIIHWVNPYDSLDRLYVDTDNLKSFVKFNPDWRFYIWTYASTRRLIKDSLPELLELWDDHSVYRYIKKRRMTLAKYVILYLHGGIIVDQDAKNYRSLDTVISKYSCIIPSNPYEEAIITGVPYTLTNRVMICQKHHPFLKFIVENLSRYQHMTTDYDAIGDGFLTTHYQIYNNLQRELDEGNMYVQHNRRDTNQTSPYLSKGDIASSHPDAVYVPNSVYFTGASDPNKQAIYIKTCSNWLEAPYLYQRACVHLYRYGLVRKPGKYAYINLHTTSKKGLKCLKKRDLMSEIPEIVYFNDDTTL